MPTADSVPEVRFDVVHSTLLLQGAYSLLGDLL